MSRAGDVRANRMYQQIRAGATPARWVGAHLLQHVQDQLEAVPGARERMWEGVAAVPGEYDWPTWAWLVAVYAHDKRTALDDAAMVRLWRHAASDVEWRAALMVVWLSAIGDRPIPASGQNRLPASVVSWVRRTLPKRAQRVDE